MRNVLACTTTWSISLAFVYLLVTAVAVSDDKVIVIENCRVFEPESEQMLSEPS